MAEHSPEQLWLQVGADIARALSALDASLASDDLAAAERVKVQAARDGAAAALAEHRKLTPAQVGAHYSGVSVLVRCGGCGDSLDEVWDLTASARQPCPRCGSLARQKDLGLPG